MEEWKNGSWEVGCIGGGDWLDLNELTMNWAE